MVDGRAALRPRGLRRQPARAGGLPRAWSTSAGAASSGTIKSINVNVGPLLAAVQPAGASRCPAGMDWDMWLGPAPWAPYNTARCDGNFGTGGGSWRSYSDYSGGGMTDWGAHHFGGATFAVDVRELQPEEVIYHDENGRQVPDLPLPQRHAALPQPSRHGEPAGRRHAGREAAAEARARATRARAASTATSSMREDPREAVPRHRAGRQHRWPSATWASSPTS